LGLRAGMPYATAGCLLSFSFGVAARPVIGALATVVMSVIVFAGASQFAALAVLVAGGGPIPAVLAAILLNLRFVPMGIALAPSLTHSPLGRAIRAQAIVDASWALARRDGGRYDLRFMYGATVVQYLSWVAGTVVGVVLGPVLGDTKALGLDVIFPAFFLALLASELGRPHARAVAALGAAIAIVLTPLVPAGIPIVAASAAMIIGLRG
jgi:4-azaleucine resistance transporter AzlC